MQASVVLFTFPSDFSLTEMIDVSTIQLTFIVRSVAVNRWQLDVNISWAKPQGVMSMINVQSIVINLLPIDVYLQAV